MTSDNKRTAEIAQMRLMLQMLDALHIRPIEHEIRLLQAKLAAYKEQYRVQREAYETEVKKGATQG